MPLSNPIWELRLRIPPTGDTGSTTGPVVSFLNQRADFEQRALVDFVERIHKEKRRRNGEEVETRFFEFPGHLQPREYIITMQHKEGPFPQNDKPWQESALKVIDENADGRAPRIPGLAIDIDRSAGIIIGAEDLPLQKDDGTFENLRILFAYNPLPLSRAGISIVRRDRESPARIQ